MMGFFVLALVLFGGVLVALLVGGGVLLHEGGSDGSRSARSSGATARRALDERLARGEISREEHEQIRRQIES